MKLSLLSAISSLLISTTCAAVPLAKVTLKGLPKALPKDGALFVKSVALGSGAVLDTKKSAAGATFSVPVNDEPALVGVSFTSRVAPQYLAGVSKPIASGLSAAETKRALAVTLKKQRSAARRSQRARLELPTTEALSNDTLAIGVPNDGITLQGKGLAPHMGPSQAAMLVYEFVHDSSCYNQPGGYVVTELSPQIEEAREKELTLCASGFSNPAGCAPDTYEGPSRLLKGTLSTVGNKATLRLTVTDLAGNILNESSATGSVKTLKAWEKLTTEASKNLKAALCETESLSVTSATCETPSCNKDCGTSQAVYIVPTMKGIARGSVGANVVAALPPQIGVMDCGGWTNDVCGGRVCCRRTSELQPNEINFTVNAYFDTNPCICLFGGTFPFVLNAQIEGEDLIEEERTVDCPM